MNVIFPRYTVVDFCVNLLLTIIIISPVVCFSWDSLTGATVGDFVFATTVMLAVGTAWFSRYLFFPALMARMEKEK